MHEEIQTGIKWAEYTILRHSVSAITPTVRVSVHACATVKTKAL